MDPRVDLESIQTTWNQSSGTDEERAAQFFLVKDNDGNITLEKKPEGAWKKFCHFFYRLTHKQKYNILNNARTLSEAIKNNQGSCSPEILNSFINRAVQKIPDKDSSRAHQLNKLKLERQPSTYTTNRLPADSFLASTPPQQTPPSSPPVVTPSIPLENLKLSNSPATSSITSNTTTQSPNSSTNKVEQSSPQPLHVAPARQEPTLAAQPQSTASQPPTPTPTPDAAAITPSPKSPLPTPPNPPGILQQPTPPSPQQTPPSSPPVVTPSIPTAPPGSPQIPRSTDALVRTQTIPQYTIPEPEGYRFGFDWELNTPLGIDPNTLDPEALIAYHAQGGNVSPEIFLRKANQLASEISRTSPKFGQTMTTLHLLYDRAAELYERQGDMIKAFEARKMAAEKAIPSAEPRNIPQEINRANEGNRSHWSTVHRSDLDTGVLKGGHIALSNRVIDKQPVITQFEFKLSHYARHDLQTSLFRIQNNIDTFRKSLPQQLQNCQVTITEVDDTFAKKNDDGTYTTTKGFTPVHSYYDESSDTFITDIPKAIKIEFEGIGSVIVGNSTNWGSLYNNVKLQINQEPPQLVELRAHQMLTMLGLGPLLNEQRPIDQERMKLALIYRTYHPASATKLERSREFYELPLEMLRAKMIEQSPEMENEVARYNADPTLIGIVEIYPGKKQFALKDISAQLKTPYAPANSKAIGLMAGVGGQKATVKMHHAADSIVGILKGGLRSTQDRYQEGLFIDGCSSSEDLVTGGADQVFCRMVTNQMEHNPINSHDANSSAFKLSGIYQLAIDLDVVNRGAYCYESDSFGKKNPYNESGYSDRPVLSFLKDTAHTDNEVMVKNHIPKEKIRSIVCQSEEAKAHLIERLNQEGLVRNGMINGKRVEEFVRVANHFTEQHWS